VLEAALGHALLAPNHKLTWPWRFIVVGPNTRTRLHVIGEKVKFGDREASAKQRAIVREKLLGPPALVVFTQVRCEGAFQLKEDYGAMACAIQNFSLSLVGHGVGSKWSTGRLTRHPETYAVLGVDAEQEEIVGFLWAGFPAEPVSAIARPPLHQFVRHVE
jgi:nitroreductase